jgi:hypothetical protein
MRSKTRMVAVIGLALGFVGGATGAAAGQAPPTLTGESFHQHRPAIIWADCRDGISFSYVARGTATGPYPGTFVEWGTLADIQLRATFTIDSPAGRVTGTKSGGVGLSCVSDFTCSGKVDCEHAPGGYNTNPNGFADENPYKATISTDRGVFADRGLFSATMVHSADDDFYLDGFDSAFQSDLESPVQQLPSTKAQCKHGGWRWYRVFKNQGECLRFVATNGEPG